VHGRRDHDHVGVEQLLDIGFGDLERLRTFRRVGGGLNNPVMWCVPRCAGGFATRSRSTTTLSGLAVTYRSI
jgi:hypothetical protein